MTKRSGFGAKTSVLETVLSLRRPAKPRPRIFCAARDKAGEGASRTPSLRIVDEQGVVIGHVSYKWSRLGQAHPTCLARSRFTTPARELTENEH